MSGLRDRVGAFLAAQADNAGRATWVWTTFVVFMMIEAVGAFGGMPRQIPAVERFGWGVVGGAWDLLPAWAVGADPYQWLVSWVPMWGHLFVALLLITLLALVRQRRGPGLNRRALRIVAVWLARLVMLTYAVHLVVWRAAPLLVTLTLVSLVLLAFFVTATILVVRFGAGKRPVDQRSAGGRSWRRLLTRTGMVAPIAVGAVLLAAQAPAIGATGVRTLPLEPSTPSAVTGYRTLLDGDEMIFALWAPRWVEIAAYDRWSRSRLWVWRQEVDRPPVEVTLTADGEAVYAQLHPTEEGGPSWSLSRLDGQVRWSRESGTLWATAGVLVALDEQRLSGLVEATGQAKWFADLQPEASILWYRVPETENTYLLKIIEPDGRFRVLDPVAGVVLRDTAGFAAAPDLALMAGGRVVHVQATAPYVVVGEAMGDSPAWTFEAPPEAGDAAYAVECAGYLCVVDAAGVTVVDTTGGYLRSRTPIPGGVERLRPWSAGVLVDTPSGTLALDPADGRLAEFGELTVQPAAYDALLLHDGVTGLVALYESDARRWTPLGPVNDDLSTCDWDYWLVCAGPTVRIWDLSR